MIEADLTGGSSEHPAMMFEGREVFLRDITQQGYGMMLKPADGEAVRGEKLDEWYPLPTYTLFEGAPERTLRLPIEETPDVPWETDLDKWIVIDIEQGRDVTQQIPDKIDAGVAEGKTTLCFPQSEKYKITGPIRVHGHINRIIGMSSIVHIPDTEEVFKPSEDEGRYGTAVFTFENLTSDTIVVERFFLLGGWDIPRHVTLFENKTDATMVAKNVNSRGIFKKPQPGGTWFLEDVSPGRGDAMQVAEGEKMWARQFNPESPWMPMIEVAGGQLWLLGLKTEGRATHLTARNGAKVELLGGVAYQSWNKQELDPPAFIIDNSDVSLTVGFYHWKEPFSVIVEETRDGETRTLGRKEIEGYHMPLYRSAAEGGDDTVAATSAR